MLRNLNSGAQQNRIIKHNRKHQNEGQPKIYGGNAVLNKYVLRFFWGEDSHSFRCFQSDGEFISDPRRSDRESKFTQVKFCFMHNKL